MHREYWLFHLFSCLCSFLHRRLPTINYNNCYFRTNQFLKMKGFKLENLKWQYDISAASYWHSKKEPCVHFKIKSHMPALKFQFYSPSTLPLFFFHQVFPLLPMANCITTSPQGLGYFLMIPYWLVWIRSDCIFCLRQIGEISSILLWISYIQKKWNNFRLLIHNNIIMD